MAMLDWCNFHQREDECEWKKANGMLKETQEFPTRVFETGATRDSDDGKLDYEGFIAPSVWRGFAEYMHKCRLRNIPPGQKVRSSDNWQKGIPQEQYIKSLIRHVMETWINWRNSKVELDTLYAILFNTQGMILEELKKLGSNRPE